MTTKVWGYVGSVRLLTHSSKTHSVIKPTIKTHCVIC